MHWLFVCCLVGVLAPESSTAAVILKQTKAFSSLFVWLWNKTQLQAFCIQPRRFPSPPSNTHFDVLSREINKSINWQVKGSNTHRQLACKHTTCAQKPTPWIYRRRATVAALRSVYARNWARRKNLEENVGLCIELIMLRPWRGAWEITLHFYILMNKIIGF